MRRFHVIFKYADFEDNVKFGSVVIEFDEGEKVSYLSVKEKTDYKMYIEGFSAITFQIISWNFID